MTLRRGHHLLGAVGLCVAVAGARASGAEKDGVSIAGARQGGTHDWAWTITNNSNDYITRFRAAHFRGRWSVVPDGWEETAMTGNVARGQAPKPGIIEWSAKDPRDAIGPGETATFTLRLDQLWPGAKGPRPVTVTFAGGKTVTFDVLCPTPQPFLTRYFPVLGLGFIFATFLLIRAIRVKRRADRATSESAAGP